MKDNSPTPRTALNSFVDELSEEYEKWYSKSSRRVYISWGVLQLFAVISGFLAAILAAIQVETFWIIVTPSLGSLAATVLLQFRVYELWRLRERGRLTFQRLASEGTRRMAAASNDEECMEIHQDLEKRALSTEEEQAIGFFSLWSSNFVGTFQTK